MNYRPILNPTVFRPTKYLAGGRQEPLGRVMGYVNKQKLPIDAKYRAITKEWDTEEMFAEKGFLAKKRMLRESWINVWKHEMNQSAKMALWQRHRYEEAKHNPKSDDAKKYRAYLRYRSEQRDTEIIRKTNSHDEWKLRDLYEEPETPQRGIKLDMFQVNSELVRISGKYIEWVGEELNGRKVYHNSARDTYYFWAYDKLGKRSTWCISVTDPRDPSSDANIAMFCTCSHRLGAITQTGQNTDWQLREQGIKELKTEGEELALDVVISLERSVDDSGVRNEQSLENSHARYDRIKHRENNFKGTGTAKAIRNKVGNRGWMYEDEDYLFHKSRNQNEKLRNNITLSRYNNTTTRGEQVSTKTPQVKHKREFDQILHRCGMEIQLDQI